MVNTKVDNLDFNEEDESIKVFPDEFPSEELKDSLFQEHDISGNNLQNGDLPDTTPKKNITENFTINTYGTLYAVGQQVKYYKPMVYVYR
jgi:hypothetical protein